MRRFSQFLVALALLARGAPAFAQSTGAVSGTVTASTGLALPGAIVTLHNSIAGPDRSVQTQTDGSYLFTNLSITGTYEIQAELQGFATVVHSGVMIGEGQRLSVDFTLYGDSVFVVREDGKDANGKPVLKVTRTFVKTGERDQNRVAILDGVSPGDQVVISGQLKLQSGTEVVVTPSQALEPPAKLPNT